MKHKDVRLVAAGLALLAAAAFADDPFAGAEWIGTGTAIECGPQPEFSCTFTSDRGGENVIRVSGLGQYAAYLNGERLGGDRAGIQPGFSDTSKTVLYDTFKVSLKAGENTLRILLGNGFYRVPRPNGRYAKYTGSQGDLKLLVGGAVKSGVDWKWRTTPLVYNHEYGGDDWFWDHAYGAWQPVARTEAPSGELVPAPFAITLHETAKGRRIGEVSAGKELWDFAQNAAYVPEIRVKGPKGAGVRVFFSESLNAARNDLYGNAFERKASIGYILKGDPEGETFRPPFYWTGFRFARVELAAPHGGGELPTVIAFDAHVLQADIARTGDFTCSSELFNRIRDLVWWAQRSNTTWTFTDCPHREKLGWQEQNNCHVDQMMWEWNAPAVYEKVMRDIRDIQTKLDGFVPDICPELTVFSGGFRNSPEWGSTAVILPWTMYEWTGDRSFVERHYDVMVRYFDWLEKNQGDGLILRGGLGDWLELPRNGGVAGVATDKSLVATAYFYRDARVLADAARLLGRTADETRYRAKAEAIRTAFNGKWRKTDADGVYYANGTQAEHALAVVWGIAGEADRSSLVRRIVADIVRRGDNVTCGEVCYPYVLRVLQEAGEHELIYRMTSVTDTPSYGYMVKKGETTLHEAWDCNPGLSHNHYMFGDVLDWYYSGLAGIRRTSPGFATVTIRPAFVRGISRVRAHYNVKGGAPIAVDWRRRADGTIRVDVEIPAGVKATIDLPGVPRCEQTASRRSYTVEGRVPAARAEALDAKTWETSEWISVAAAPVAGNPERKRQRAADGTSCFRYRHVNAKDVRSVKWMTAGLGTYGLYLNGVAVGTDYLKPGFTHCAKTRRAFTYDVTALVRKAKGEANDFGAEASAGWWRDKIVNYAGKKSAFRGVLAFTYADGTTELVGTKASEWFGETAGPVTHAGIFDGEEYDARLTNCARCPWTDFAPGGCERNDEFKGEILPTDGAEVCLRDDLVEKHGLVRRNLRVRPGEPLVVDFGQNCAAVPRFTFRAKRGTVLTVLPGEMLNDADRGSRGCDGPKGSVFRANLRMVRDGMRIIYTFAGGGWEEYVPSYTFFGYRYLSITATDEVEIESVESVPVTSVTKEMETMWIETGDRDVNRLIANAYWSQLSNYLSVPTDCPQRSERLGWMGDAQIFAEAGAFNADTRRFFRKWTRDIRDSQHAKGGFTGVAPVGQYGNEPMRIGWADAGVIVPYRVWRQFGDTSIVDANWSAMERYLARVGETRYDYEATKSENGGYQWADWLSYEKLESHGGGAFERAPNGGRRPKADAVAYWNYLGACYWLRDARMMAAMAKATGRDAAKYVRMADEARDYIRAKFIDGTDGMLLPVFRDMQTPALFALKLGLVEGEAKAKTAAALRKNFADHGGCLQTGLHGTSVLMDALAENGMSDLAYDVLFSRRCPGWLYSVDQGATTIWELWNSYGKDSGFTGGWSMNSFNHYAYGAVVAWIYKFAAGIASDPENPGFRNIVMRPIPDRRLGFVRAEYNSAAGLIKSDWRYEGDKWIWDFTVPEGATASVILPGEDRAVPYAAGTHHVEKTIPLPVRK